MRKRYTAEFKAQVVLEILKGDKTIGQIASEHGIHPHQLYGWRDAVLTALPGIFTSQVARAAAQLEAERHKERDELYAVIGRLTIQNDWLKKKAGVE